MEILEAGASRFLIDRGLALNAAGSGVPVSSLATTFALLFPVLIVAAILFFIFAPWQIGVTAILGAIVSFKASRHFTKEDVAKEDVAKAALQDPRLLRLLMEKGVVWFEMADR
jgi:hypothetical protein